MFFNLGKIFLLLAASGTIILAFVFLVFDLTEVADAQVAVFHPATCLGGWKHVSQASGPPEVSFSVTFNDKNSAILEDVVTQLYCGSFTGELPIQSRHTKVTLRFSWDEESAWDLVGEDISEIAEESEDKVSTEAETVVKGETVIDLSVATSSLASTTLTGIIESNSTSSSELLENTGLGGDLSETFLGTSSATTIVEATSSSIILPPDVSEATTSDETILPVLEEVSDEVIVNEGVGTEVQEDETFPEEVVSETLPEEMPPAPETDVLEEGESVSRLRNLLVPNVYAEETETTSTDIELEEVMIVDTELKSEAETEEVETIEKESDNSSVVPAGARFEVRYTLDNENWSTLGYVSEISNDVRFVFPDEVFKSVIDIEKVQIALVTLPQVDDFRRVYLDAMWLEVAYEKVIELGVHTVLTEPLRVVSALPTFMTGTSTGTGLYISTSTDISSRGELAEMIVAEELATNTATATTESFLVYIDEVMALKGISDRLVLLTRAVATTTELWLIDLLGVKSTLIGNGETAVGTYPVASKDSIIFWRGVGGDRIFSYDLRTGGTLGQMLIVANLPEQNDFPRFTFPFTEWEVILGADRFNFFSRQTGEVFSDEDTIGVEKFITETNLIKLGSYEYFENLGIYPGKVESEMGTIISI